MFGPFSNPAQGAYFQRAFERAGRPARLTPAKSAEDDMTLGDIFDSIGGYFTAAAEILAGNAAAKAAGATTLQIIAADAGAVVKLVPAAIAPEVAVAVDITDEVIALAQAIKAAHSGVTAKVPAPAAPLAPAAPAAH